MTNRTCPWQVDTLYPAQGGPYFHEALNKIIGTEIVARQPVHGFLCIDKEVHLCSRIDYQIYTCIVEVQDVCLHAVLGTVYCQLASSLCYKGCDWLTPFG